MNTRYKHPDIFKPVDGEDKRDFGLWFERAVSNTFKDCFTSAGMYITSMQSNPRSPEYNPDSRFCDFKLMMNDKAVLLAEVKSVGVNRQSNEDVTQATWNHNALFNEEQRGSLAPLLQAQWPALRDRSKRLSIPYMIIMLIMPNIDRHQITMAAKAGFNMLSESMKLVSQRARVLTVFGHGDQYGARVYKNYHHFHEWLKHHPNPIDSLSFTSGHVDDFYEGSGVFHRAPASDQYLELIHEMDKDGRSEVQIANHLNRCGAYIYGWDSFGYTPKDCIVNEIIGDHSETYQHEHDCASFSKYMIEYMLSKDKCDPQILLKELSTEDLNQLEGFLTFRSPRRQHAFDNKSTCGFYLQKTELRAFEDWAKCLIQNFSSRSFKKVPSFPSRVSVAQLIAVHPQGNLIRMALDCSRGLITREGFRAHIKERLCLSS